MGRGGGLFFFKETEVKVDSPTAEKLLELICYHFWDRHHIDRRASGWSLLIPDSGI
jgi:hypothetical protein